MSKFKSDKEKTIGILYDLIVNKNIKLEFLEKQAFDNEIITALSCLIKEQNEEDNNYLSRLAKNLLARNVKIAELEYRMEQFQKNNSNNEDFLTFVTEFKLYMDYLCPQE